MKKYRGAEGCAGCGTPASQRGRDSKNDICDDCKELLKIGKHVRITCGVSGKSKDTAMIGLSAYSPPAWRLPDDMLIERKSNAHQTRSMPSISSEAGAEYSSYNLNQAVREFLISLSVDLGANTIKRPADIYCEDSSESLEIPRHQIRAFLKFYDTICGYMQILEERGKAKGKNILLSLIRKEAEIYDFK